MGRSLSVRGVGLGRLLRFERKRRYTGDIYSVKEAGSSELKKKRHRKRPNPASRILDIKREHCHLVLFSTFDHTSSSRIIPHTPQPDPIPPLPTRPIPPNRKPHSLTLPSSQPESILAPISQHIVRIVIQPNPRRYAFDGCYGEVFAVVRQSQARVWKFDVSELGRMENCAVAEISGGDGEPEESVGCVDVAS